MNGEKFLKNKFFSTEKYILLIWFLLPIVNWSKDFFKGRYNNYKIFTNAFWHLIAESNLYILYPAEYYDRYLYGPLFGLIIAPFALLPNVIGCLFWGLFNTGILYYALCRLGLQTGYKVLLMLFITVELANSIWSNQFNPSVVALLLLAYSDVENKKNFLAPLWILIGSFVKIYSIAGLVFFLFSKDKLGFVAGCLFWFLVLFIAPVIITSPEFLIQSYLDWYSTIITKASTNTLDISVMGFIRRTTGYLQIPSIYFLITGGLLMLLPLLRFNQFNYKLFRIYFLSSLLAFVVLFSPGSEHPTYIICVTGICLWLITQPIIFTKANTWILVFVIGWSGLAPTDLYSVSVRKLSTAYALKAAPCFFVWLLMQYDLLFRDFGEFANQIILRRFEKK